MNRRDFGKALFKGLGAIGLFSLTDRLAQQALAASKPNRRIIDNDECLRGEFIQEDIEFRSGMIMNCQIDGSIYVVTAKPKLMTGCTVKIPKNRAFGMWISKEANTPKTRIEYNYFFNEGYSPSSIPNPAASATGSATA